MSSNTILFSFLALSLAHIFPVMAVSHAADRGAGIFQSCVSCHGQLGEGNEKLAAPAIAGLPAWYIETQLGKFRDGIRGKHPGDLAGLRMRPMARTIPENEDVKLVAEHVSKLKPAVLSQVVKGSVVRGEELYKVCTACHGPDAKGNQTVLAPSLTEVSDWYLVTQLKNFKAGIRGGNATLDPTGATMQGMASSLDEQGVHDVVSYIQTLKQ